MYMESWTVTNGEACLRSGRVKIRRLRTLKLEDEMNGSFYWRWCKMWTSFYCNLSVMSYQTPQRKQILTNGHDDSPIWYLGTQLACIIGYINALKKHVAIVAAIYATNGGLEKMRLYILHPNSTPLEKVIKVTDDILVIKSNIGSISDPMKFQ